MKKIMLCSLFVSAMIFSTLANDAFKEQESPVFFVKNTSNIVLGYDKSMGKKTIKAAVIDSYFRNVASNGKIVRWNKSSFPLKVYIQDTPDMPDYYREIIMNAYSSWQRASEGLVSFEFLESPEEAQIKCFFKGNDSQNIAIQSFGLKGNTLETSTINFKMKDAKNQNIDSKQLYSSALQAIGFSLGINGKSQSIYDVMYPIGVKFNTEITPRDLKTLALLYSVVPDVTNIPLSEEEKMGLLSVSDALGTMNIPTSNEDIASQIDSKLHLAEEYRRKAEYDKAAEEYQAVALLKEDRRSKSEVYYEVAVMYLDAEEFDKAKECAEVACATDENDLTETLPALIGYYTKQSNSSIEQLETILELNPYNKHAYKLLCQIYRDKHHENMLNATIRKWGKTAGSVKD